MHTQTMFKRVTLAYEAFITVATSFESLLLLGVRLYSGWQFAQTGGGKLQHLPKVTNFFATLGIPAPYFSAAAISWLELIGGVGLALGISSRFWGLLLAGDMFVAYLRLAGKTSCLCFLIQANFMATTPTHVSFCIYTDSHIRTRQAGSGLSSKVQALNQQRELSCGKCW